MPGSDGRSHVLWRSCIYEVRVRIDALAAGARFGRPPCRSYPICSQVKPILPNVAYRRRGQGQLTVSSASLPPANCTKLCYSGMADRQACLACWKPAGRSALASRGVRGCARPFEPPRVVRLWNAVQLTDGCFPFFSFEKADLSPALSERYRVLRPACSFSRSSTASRAIKARPHAGQRSCQFATHSCHHSHHRRGE